MCGLCGVAFADPARVASRETIERMNATIAHRGPDDSGMFLAGPVGLGHRRLSIVDLTTGHQPMANEDGTVSIVFNGEIYNHADFRDRLLARGHRFRTRSDTEAIIHLYEEQGPACAAELRGMFAYALWDQGRRRLVLARDHSGIKPMYFALDRDGNLVFGSEIKALFASGLLEPELDGAAVPEYLATGHVSGERTLFKGIRKLPPGHWLSWEAGKVVIESYWKLPAWDGAAAAGSTGDLAAAGDEFWRRFVDSVRSQLMSDVPLGAFLSGGLDSSLLVAAMHELGVSSTSTFSVGYAEAGSSELPWARVAARAFGTRHHEVTLGESRFFEVMPELTWHRDLPLTFSASIPLFIVSELAAGTVKVVLTGEGSDELFAGYGRYPRALLNLRWGRHLDAALPGTLRRGLARLAGGLGEGYLGSRARRSFLHLPGTVEAAYLEAFAEIDAPARSALLGHAANGWGYAEPLRLLDREVLAANPLEALLRLDQRTYLEELLMKQDTMSMASSIESRVPFLDHRLMEWAAGLAPGLKLRGMTGKAVVRAAAAARLPRELVGGPKRGFLVPIGEWLRGSHGRRLMEETALGDAGAPVLDHAAIRRVWDRHRSGQDETARLWRVLAFRLWQTDTLPRMAALAGAGKGALTG
jgi:asparagine synthase (glutamine-hydrolysing)